MTRLLSVLFLTVTAMAALTGCPNNNGNQPVAAYPYVGGPYANCVPGQPCPATPNGLFAPTGYVHFVGELAALKNDVARGLIRDYYNMLYWCWGNCYSYSNVDVMITPTPAGAIANVTLNIGGYPISGQAQALPINNNSGTDLKLIPFGASAGTIDIISNNYPLDGSVTAVPAIEIQYNGQHLATTSLVRAGY